MEKILGIAGSPREGGNTEHLTRHLLDEARREGAETRLFSVAGRSISPCINCDQCGTTPDDWCAQHDDMYDLYPHMLWADAIVFGTPVYMANMSAQLKAVLDRCRPLWRRSNLLSHKVAAAIAVGGGAWGGQELAIQSVLWSALNHGMIVVGSVSLRFGNWEVAGTGAAARDVLEDEEALHAAAGLGRRLARLQVQGA